MSSQRWALSTTCHWQELGSKSAAVGCSCRRACRVRSSPTGAMFAFPALNKSPAMKFPHYVLPLCVVFCCATELLHDMGGFYFPFSSITELSRGPSCETVIIRQALYLQNYRLDHKNAGCSSQYVRQVQSQTHTHTKRWDFYCHVSSVNRVKHTTLFNVIHL